MQDRADGPAGVSVVIPVYRSRDCLHELHERLVGALERVTPRFEIIMVEDCGGDDSWQVIRELAARDRRVRGIQLGINSGQHNAILCGIRAARGEIIVTLDDDLQNPPEEIPRLLEPLAEGYDVVYGTPVRQKHGFWRKLASALTKIVLRRAMGARTARNISAFRAFRTRLRQAFAHYQGSFVSIDVLLTWGTKSFASVAVRHDRRLRGRSHYSFLMLVTHAFNMMTGFSTLPLQLASVTGFTFTLFGLAVLVYVVGRYLIQGSSVPGFPFLASVIAIFSGAQLFALGIIGEYLARMHFRIMERLPYVVRETTDDGGRAENS